MARRPQLNPTLLAVMLLWGFNFVALKLVYREVPAIPAAIFRWFLMTSLLVLTALALKVSLKYPKGMAWRVHLQGFLSMGLYMYVFVTGMQWTGAAEGGVCLGMTPIFTLLLAIIFRQEPFRWKVLGGTLVAFIGVAVVAIMSPDVQTHGSQGLLGPVLLILAAFIWACGTVISRPLLNHMEPMALTILAMPAGGLFLCLVGWQQTAQVPWTHLSGFTYGMLLYFSLGAGYLGFWLFYRGVEQAGAAGAMLYQYFVAPVSAVLAYFTLGRGLSAPQIGGMVILIAGVFMANGARRAQPMLAQPAE